MISSVNFEERLDVLYCWPRCGRRTSTTWHYDAVCRPSTRLHAHRRSASVRQFTAEPTTTEASPLTYSRPSLHVPYPCPAAYVHWVVLLLCHRRRVDRRRPCHSIPTWLSANSDAFYTELMSYLENLALYKCQIVISTSTPSAVMTQRPRDSLIFCSVLAAFKTYH